MKHNIVAFDDGALIGWLLELIEEPAPQFLSFLAEAAILADREEYAILRPGLLVLKRKHMRPVVTSSMNGASHPSPKSHLSCFVTQKEHRA